MNILDFIGNTPLVRLKKVEEKYNLNNRLYAKLEMLNPSGSIKIRPATYIINEGIRLGYILNDTKIVEATSGNFGIALALVCSIYNLHLEIYLPKNTNSERIKLIKQYGGNVNLVDGNMKKCQEIVNEFKNKENYFIPNQFENILNPYSYYLTLAKELKNDLEKIDYLVCGIGSGGTIMGCANYLNNTKMIGVLPKNYPHKIIGIGAGFRPKVLDYNLIEEIIKVDDKEINEYHDDLIKEGLLVGLSAKAAFAGALSIARRENNKNIVVIFPDGGERYLSML